jgi:hypothetical protein
VIGFWHDLEEKNLSLSPKITLATTLQHFSHIFGHHHIRFSPHFTSYLSTTRMYRAMTTLSEKEQLHYSLMLLEEGQLLQDQENYTAAFYCYERSLSMRESRARTGYRGWCVRHTGTFVGFSLVSSLFRRIKGATK